MGKKIFFAITLCAGLLFVAGCRNHTPEQKVDYMADRISSRLELNAEQKVLLKDLTDSIKLDMKSHAADSETFKAEALKQVKSAELDVVKIKQMMTEHQSTMQKNMDKYLPKVAVLHKSLSDKQKGELAEMLEHLFKHFGR